MRDQQIVLNRRSIGKLLGVAITLLLIANLLGQIARFGFGHDHVYGLVPLFNVDKEQNIPTFFTVLIILANALLLATIGIIQKQTGRIDSHYWFFLAAGFLFFAYDESFQVHEKLTGPMRSVLGDSELGMLYFGWVVPGIIGVIILALLFVNFLRRLPQTTRYWMLISATIYLSGCIGMELLDGRYVEAHGPNFTYHLLITVEEGLEMAGLSTFLVTLLGHISNLNEKVEVYFCKHGVRQTDSMSAGDPLLESSTSAIDFQAPKNTSSAS